MPHCGGLKNLSGTVGEITLTVEQLASHTHSCPQASTDGGAGRFTGGGTAEGTLTTQNTGGSQPHTHPLTGASVEANSLPPYYVLAYIMRTA